MDSGNWSFQNVARTLGGSPAWPWAARAVTVALVIALGYRLADVTWALTGTEEAMARAPTTEPTASAPSRSSGNEALSGEALASLHLFGEPAAGEKEEPAPIDAPETKLNLTLHGILHSDDDTEAGAIIAGSGEPAQHYRVGTEVPGGATLERIYRDRVILKRSGRFETLKLPRDKLDTAAGSRTAGASGGGALGAAAAPLLEKLDRNPRSLLREFDVKPVVKEGQLTGFRIQPKERSVAFEALDIRPDDVVRSVNGIQLSNAAKAKEAVDSLSGESRVSITVERNGSLKTFTYNLGG